MKHYHRTASNFGWSRSAWVIACHHRDTVRFELFIDLENHQTHLIAWTEVCIVVRQKMDWNSWGLTCGPALGLSWLMCSLAPIRQPRALTINPGWLLIGTEGDTARPITGSLPEPPQLRHAYLWPCLCTVIGQLESIRMKGIGGLITDLSRSHTLKQEHTHRSEELSAQISELGANTSTHLECLHCTLQMCLAKEYTVWELDEQTEWHGEAVIRSNPNRHLASWVHLYMAL